MKTAGCTNKGFMLVLLGPDGSGKTTVRNSLLESLRTLFPSVRSFYFRPELLPFPGVFLGLREDVQTGVNPDPHGHNRENPLKSLVRFFYYLVDFILGYMVKVRPSLKQGGAVIFDRYYYDYFVDRFRYNMSVPSWFPRLFLPLIPHPNLIICLHATAKTLYERKQELSPNELGRQLEAFDKLLKILPHSFKISVEKPISEITEEIVNLVKHVQYKDG